MPVNVHYVSNNGGMVEIESPTNKNELEQNMEIAIFLADNGHKVKLLRIDASPGIKNPMPVLTAKLLNLRPIKGLRFLL